MTPGTTHGFVCAEPHRSWAFYDRRTGKRSGMASYRSAEQCAQQLAYWWRRDRKGGRPDLHDKMPHLAYIELTDRTWGSSPGDIIAEP